MLCGSACAASDDEPRLEFLDFNRECLDSCGVSSVERALRIEVAAGTRPVQGQVQWMLDADSNEVLAAEDVALAAGEQTTVTLRNELDGSCSTAEAEVREVTVWIDLAGERFELSGDGYFGSGWNEC
jgi:hypothetical protein